MKDLFYKEYSEEESSLYKQAMDKIMKGMEDGMTFHESCAAVSLEDNQLRDFVVDDALKIMIADLHYKKGLPLQRVAEILQMPIDGVKRANAEMLDDISLTVSEMYGTNDPAGHVGNA